MTKSGMKRFEKLVAQLPSYRNRKIGIIRNVRQPVVISDLAVKHVAHEEISGQSHSTKFG